MANFPDDIFTEPEDVDPDALANLGPLRRLAGIWEGDRGIDVNPKADGPERRVYRERIEMHPIDPQANGPQLFYGLRYHVHVNTPEEATTFHDQVGYWLWEPATGLVLQTVAIPRGQVAIARWAGIAGCHGAHADRHARPDRIWHLLDDIPRTCLPHRILFDRSHVQSGRFMELHIRHDAGRPRAARTVPAP